MRTRQRPSHSKYANKKTNGFASKREANQAAALQALERGGVIKDLKFQVPFVLIPKIGTERECKYIADFTFTEAGKQVVADAKGAKTPVYQIKKKLMRWVHGIEIKEL